MSQEQTKKIEYIAINDLIPYVNNARVHSEEQILQIASSIKEFGFNNPVLIDKGNGIIAGHGRVYAARKLGLEEIPVIRIEHLSKAQKKAFIIADNKIALNASWNHEILALEFSELTSENFNIELTGFIGDDLNEIMFNENEIQNAPDSFKDVDEIELEKKCPRCGFEFDESICNPING